MGDPDIKMPPIADGKSSDEDRMWAMFAHLSGLIGLSCLGPLIIWLVKKDSSAFVEDQAKEALNFQLTLLIAAIVLGATCIGVALLPVIVVGGIVYAVIGGMAANRGEIYRYPYTFRMIN
ncbi:MAG: DUF4870 domain-containing protein [Pirellulaceae bacterium]|jgi:hypothetical protein|nr:DUF4870 domain-containing protein [Pirellulaceae bacterium]MDP6719703.1 DUF4870 domain-containing protein [Pirellulaceae bacterium]